MQKERTGHEHHSSQNYRREYYRNMFRYKIPKQYERIILPEVIISLLLFLMLKAGMLNYTTNYKVAHTVGITLYWVLIAIWAENSHLNTHSLKHYYICNLGAFAMFLLTAAVCFVINYFSGLYPRDYLSFTCFRLSYVFALLGDMLLNENEVVNTFLVFFLGTFGILMLEPLCATVLAYSGMEKPKKHHHHHHYHHHHEHSGEHHHHEHSGE